MEPPTASLERRALRITLLLLLAGSASAQNAPVLLWPNGAPGSEGKTAGETVRVTENDEHIVSSVHRPSITPFLPSKENATGAAVIIAPGGGHHELWMDHEGYNVARWLGQHGVAAFVLKYRLARENGSTYTIEGTELADIQRAIRLVRSRASEWGINPEHIGVMGFSAGGELAALSATRYGPGLADAVDPIERENSKPAFQALLYPAIPHDMSLSKQTPPAFLVCGEDDRPDIAEGLPHLYLSLKQAGVSTELHVFARTGHGFGVRPGNRPPVSDWPQLFLEWLDVQGMLAHK
ncbi:MAG: alpha/beta hydrolase [Candidatus Sulfotelmatobacter sp.]